MSKNGHWKITTADLEILHELAKRKLEIANNPVNLERKHLWYLLDEGKAERPMVLTEAGVVFNDLPGSQLHCQEEWARQFEYGLRFEIFVFEEIRDDHVVELIMKDVHTLTGEPRRMARWVEIAREVIG